MTTPPPTLPPAPTFTLTDLHVTQRPEDTTTLLLLHPGGTTHGQLAKALHDSAEYPEQWADTEEAYVPFTGTLGGAPLLGAVIPEQLPDLSSAQAYLDQLGVTTQVLTFAVISADQVQPFTHTLVFPTGSTEYGPDTLILPLTVSAHEQLSRQVSAAITLAAQGFSVGNPSTASLLSDLSGLRVDQRQAHLSGYLPVLTSAELDATSTGSAYAVLHAAMHGPILTLLYTGDVSDEISGSDPYDTFPLGLTLEPSHV